MSSIRLENLEKIYPTGQRAVVDLNLQIEDGEYVVLVGPSGCGKTTTLRLIAGLEQPNRGTVFLDGDNVTQWPPHKRNVAMVFQNYALYPHLSVRENLAFPLKMQKVARNNQEEQVRQIANQLGLTDVLERRPDQLSGGQQQRVALGRALIREPRVFLLDEPLSHLDIPLRLQMRSELKQLHRKYANTFLHVTHDQEEALSLGDRVAVLIEGRLQQVAPPRIVYQCPANLAVARFIGSPPMNVFSCILREANGQPFFHCPFFDIPCPIPLSRFPSMQPIFLGIRPHDLLIASEHEADLTAEIDLVQTLGRETIVSLRIEKNEEKQTIHVALFEFAAVPAKGNFFLRIPRDKLHIFAGSSQERISF